MAKLHIATYHNWEFFNSKIATIKKFYIECNSSAIDAITTGGDIMLSCTVEACCGRVRITTSCCI